MSAERPRVLVLDDDADMQVLLQALLEHSGACAVVAGDAATAAAALAAPFDLVLLDLVMPPGVHEALVDLLAGLAAAPMIALLSGSDRHTLASARARIEARGLTVLDALVKPVRLDALAGLLARCQHQGT